MFSGLSVPPSFELCSLSRARKFVCVDEAQNDCRIVTQNTPEPGSKALLVCEELSDIVSKTNHNFTDLNLHSK